MFKPFSNAVGFLDFHPWNRELENVHRKLRSRPSTFLGSQVQHFKNFWNNPKLPKPVNWLREPHPNILHSQSSPTTSLGRVSTARSCTMPRPSERPWKAKRVSGTCRLSAKASKLQQHPGDSWLSNGLERGGGGGYEVYFPCSPKLSWWNWGVRMSFEDVVIHAWIGRRVDRHILKVKTWNLHKVTKVWGNKKPI